MLLGVDDACAASCLADLLGETHISDEPASDAGTHCPESRLVSLLDQLHVSSELAVDLESVGSTDPMLVDSDTASLDAFPTNVVIIDDPLPRADSCSSTITEVLVISHGAASGENIHDSLQTALHDLSACIPADADAETLEARRLALIAEGQKIASMRRLTEAHQREVDRAAFGTPPPGGPAGSALSDSAALSLPTH